MIAAVEWGPVAAWAGAVATFLAALTALLVALGAFEFLKAPKISITFEDTEPWCRRDPTSNNVVVWMRVGVANVGRKPARGCVGRIIAVSTDGTPRRDIDPIQLRWAGVPRSMSFTPVDLRRDQREFLNVVYLDHDDRWHITTFEDPDFDPGFPTELASNQEHVIVIAVFSDDADTATCELTITGRPDHSRDCPATGATFARL